MTDNWDPHAGRRAEERAIYAPFFEALAKIVAEGKYDVEIACPVCRKGTKLSTMNPATGTVVRECEDQHLLISNGAGGWKVEK